MVHLSPSWPVDAGKMEADAIFAGVFILGFAFWVAYRRSLCCFIPRRAAGWAHLEASVPVSRHRDTRTRTLYFELRKTLRLKDSCSNDDRLPRIHKTFTDLWLPVPSDIERQIFVFYSSRKAVSEETRMVTLKILKTKFIRCDDEAIDGWR